VEEQSSGRQESSSDEEGEDGSSADDEPGHDEPGHDREAELKEARKIKKTIEDMFFAVQVCLFSKLTRTSPEADFTDERSFRLATTSRTRGRLACGTSCRKWRRHFGTSPRKE
jgi:hypothetical protein